MGAKKNVETFRVGLDRRDRGVGEADAVRDIENSESSLLDHEKLDGGVGESRKMRESEIFEPQVVDDRAGEGVCETSATTQIQRF